MKIKVLIFLFILIKFTNANWHVNNYAFWHQYSLTSPKQSGVQLAYQSNYKLPDLATKQLYWQHQLPFLALAINYQQYGNRYYQNNLAKSIVNAHLSEVIKLGISLTYQYDFIFYHAESNPWKIHPEIGFAWDINDNWQWIKSIAAENHLREISINNLIRYRMGNVELHGSLNINQLTPQYNLALFYSFNTNFVLAYAMQSDLSRLNIKLCYRKKQYQVLFGLIFHPYLGSNETINLGYIYE